MNKCVILRLIRRNERQWAEKTAALIEPGFWATLPLPSEPDADIMSSEAPDAKSVNPTENAGS